MIRLLFSFITGLIVKLVDLVEDDGYNMNKTLKRIFSVGYGVLLAFLIKTAPLPGFWIGIILGLIFSKKIDSESHYLGVGFMIITLIMIGLPQVNSLILIITTIICVLEEWINDEIVDKNKVKGFTNQILSIRPLLETTAITLSIIYADVMIFLLLFTFDLGYILTNTLWKNKILT